MQRIIALLRWYLNELVEQFLAADCLTRAGALTYTTLFAVVPLMTVAYAMFSLLPEFAAMGERIQAFVFNNFVPESSSLVHEKLSEFSERARGLTWAGFAFLFFTAFMMLVTVEKTFNAIWQVTEPRRGVSRFLLYWAVLSLGPPLIGAGLLVSLYLMSLPLVSDLDTFGLRNLLLGYTPYLLSTLGFTVLYYAVPNCHVPFRNALIGGLLTMALFELGKGLFASVVRNSSIEPIYGTFAAVPLFLAWLYLAWTLVLSGAILVRTLSVSPEHQEEHPEPLLVKCARVLQVLYEAHLRGSPVSEQEIAERVSLNRREHDRIYRVLQELRLLQATEDERWALGRSLRALTLWDLYQRLPDGLSVDRLARVTDLPNVTEPLKSLVQFGSNEMSASLDMVFGGIR
ncbi:MAG: YihY family inner membrane protein [Pseudomonadales bacterium]